MAINLFVNRLYVLTEDNRVAYDERFHHGINIIRGNNSSGKSTITQLLFFALGGEYTNFVEEARRCARVLVEVEMNHAVVTLSRRIDKDEEGKVRKLQGMTIHWGTLDQALAHDCESHHYGFKATGKTSSFSNALFEIMGMPIVYGDSNITMHQLLRLMYIDQESPTQSLFYFEQFDSQTTRETASDLLLGIFDEELYQAKLRLKQLDADISATRSDIRSVEASLPHGKPSTKYIQGLIAEKEREIAQLADDITAMRGGLMQAKTKIKPQIEQQRKQVETLTRQYEQTDERISLLDREIADTSLFISELERKRTALNHSITTRQVLGNLRLAYCPECLSPLPDEVPEGLCRLCKSPVESHSGITQAKRIVLTLTFQIKESEEVLRGDEEELSRKKSEHRRLGVQLRQARKLLDQLLADVRSTSDEKFEDLIYNKGVLQGEILQYQTMLEAAHYYETLLEKLRKLTAEKEETDRFIKAKLSAQTARRNEVMNAMRRYGVYFLHNDERREEDFVNVTPENFNIDFSNNMTYLFRSYSKYSASSTFFLKLVARYSLFFASLDIPWMRYPHFIFADNMEDKGIEKERAQKFQQTLIGKLSSHSADDYQLIYATSFITDELNRSPYVVGEFYTEQNKSLKNV